MKSIILNVSVYLAFVIGLLVIYDKWFPPWIGNTNQVEVDSILPVTGFVFARGSDPRRTSAIKFSEEFAADMNVKDYRGKFLVLTIWAADCPLCQHELLKLDILADRLRDLDVAVIAIKIGGDSIEYIPKVFRRTSPMALRFYVDASKNIVHDIQITGLPTTILISPSGREIGRTIGPVAWDRSYVASAIRKIAAVSPRFTGSN